MTKKFANFPCQFSQLMLYLTGEQVYLPMIMQYTIIHHCLSVVNCNLQIGDFFCLFSLFRPFRLLYVSVLADFWKFKRLQARMKRPEPLFFFAEEK